jgi:hypothetical protein
MLSALESHTSLPTFSSFSGNLTAFFFVAWLGDCVFIRLVIVFSTTVDWECLLFNALLVACCVTLAAALVDRRIAGDIAEATVAWKSHLMHGETRGPRN